MKLCSNHDIKFRSSLLHNINIIKLYLTMSKYKYEVKFGQGPFVYYKLVIEYFCLNTFFLSLGIFVILGKTTFKITDFVQGNYFYI